MVFDRITAMMDRFNSGSDEEIDSFMDRHYFRMMQVSLMYVKLNRRLRWYSVLQLILGIGILTYHFYIITRTLPDYMKVNFAMFSQNIHVCLLTMLSWSLIIIFNKNRKSFLVLHRMVAEGFFDYREPELKEVPKMREEASMLRRLLLLVPTSTLLSLGAVLVTAPMIDRLGTFDFVKYSDVLTPGMPYSFGTYPFYVGDGPMYYISFILQMLHGMLLCVNISVLGYSYVFVTINAVLQMKILLLSIENIENRALHLYSSLFGEPSSLDGIYDVKEFIHCYSICLRKNIEHHQTILRYFSNLRTVYSPAVFLSYSTGTIVIALSLMSIESARELPGTAVASVFLCLAEVAYMYLFSVFSQIITDLSLDVRFKMYSIKWYDCDEGITRSVMVFQAMTLRPLSLLAGGIVPVNMDTFAKVMNSAYSYYNLANAFKIN